jgi:hypothetical protein
MKLNRPWTDRGNGQALDRPMGEFVYRIKYEGNEKVNIRRRIVHHNQENLKRRMLTRKILRNERTSWRNY